MEHDIDKVSNDSARVVLLLSFNVNSFDYLFVTGNLNPVAKYLKVKTRGMGKYESLPHCQGIGKRKLCSA